MREWNEKRFAVSTVFCLSSKLLTTELPRQVWRKVSPRHTSWWPEFQTQFRSSVSSSHLSLLRFASAVSLLVYQEKLQQIYRDIISVHEPVALYGTWHEARIGEMRNEYNILFGKLKRKRLLGRPRHRREDNIRIDLRKIGGKIVDWVHLIQDRYLWQVLVNTLMKFRVP